MTVTLGLMAQNPEPVNIKVKVTVHNKENQKDINDTVLRLNSLVTGISNSRTGMLYASVKEPDSVTVQSRKSYDPVTVGYDGVATGTRNGPGR